MRLSIVIRRADIICEDPFQNPLNLLPAIVYVPPTYSRLNPDI